ncbi:hypothetical protein [Kozakia baliensis]|uniref:hypothetical protein n=1 Tax=Kozakia baliensis TaxID=153496 RepID=UPI00191BD2FE|nr:hypothetical protein [Kozakia baliensis]
MAHALLETVFLRLKQIIGDPKALPPIPAPIPVKKDMLVAKREKRSFSSTS